MKSYKRLLALLLAFALATTPICNAYAVTDSTGSQVTGAVVEGNTEETSTEIPDASNPTETPTEESSKPTETPTETPTEDPKPVGEIKFEYDFKEQESGWVTAVSDINVVFEYAHGVKDATVMYTVSSDPSKVIEVPVNRNSAGVFSCVIPAESISDGEYSLIAKCTFEDDSNASKSLSFKVDTTDVSFENAIVSGLTVKESQTGYAKESFSISGFEDKTSGINIIKVCNVGPHYIEYDKGTPVVITKDSQSIILSDKAGNSTEITVIDLLKKLNICQEVIYDNDIPEVNIDLEGTVGHKNESCVYYTSNVNVAVSVSDMTLQDVSVVKNGETIDSLIITDGQASKIFECTENGEYRISVTATDAVKNEYTKDVYFAIDRKSPEKGTMNVEGTWQELDGKLYTNGVISIKGNPADAESGIKTIEVLNGNDVVGTLPFEISESGKYSVRVEDNVGNVSVFTFADIAGVDSSDIVWDSDSPIAEFDMNNTDKPQYINNGVYWYSKNPNVVINMSDDNIDTVSVVCYIDSNPTTVISEVSETGVYTVDTSDAKGREFKIVATIVDKSGNSTEKEFIFFVDYDAPAIGTLSVTAKPEWFEHEGYVYAREGFYISGKPEDEGAGLKSVSIYKNGDMLEKFENSEVNVSLVTENDSGSYEFVLEDNVGNAIRVNANELLGSKGNNFIVDLTSPSIVRTDSNKETVDGWYNYVPTFSYDVSDENLEVYKVTINGDEFVSANSSGMVDVDTSDYQNKAVEIVVFARDYAGNESTYTYKYSQDNTPPHNISIEMKKPVSFKGSNVYYNSDISLKISAGDALYGDISYYVNGSKVENGKYNVSESGEYSFEVRDGLGNSSGVKNLSEYFGWVGNNIVIDRESPVISASKYSGSWITGVGIYNVSISDNLGINSIVATINGINVIKNVIDGIDDCSESIVVDTTMVEPKEDGSFEVVITAEDNSGLTTTWKDIVFVDNTIPTVDKFEFGGYVNKLGSENGYNYFFDGSGTVTVFCSDASYSSGLRSIWTRLNGQDWVENSVSESGTVSISIPEDYKGSIEAYAVDNVGLKSDVNTSVNVVSESKNLHSNSSAISISLPETPYTDVNGNPLYREDFSAGLDASCKWSGLKSIQWGISDMNSISSFNGGESELNIITKYTKNIPLGGNSNGITVTAVAEDWTGHTFSDSAVFSIDKDAPVISVFYDTTRDNGYYNSSRVATVSIRERNFDPSLVTIGGSSGHASDWVRDGETWVCRITFSEDGDYAFTVDCKDRANNSAVQYVSEKFTIDKTTPIISVSWSPKDSNYENFFNAVRVATITVTERNFDSSLISIGGKGTVSGWSSNGNTHTATVTFAESGEYSLSVNGSDSAGNNIEKEYVSGNFIVDLEKPKIEVTGISNGVSYKNNVEFIVKVSDAYINNDTHVYLVGKNHEEKEIFGQFAGQTGIFTYSDFPKDSDVDDVYSLKVVAKDHAGNISEEVWNFSVNRFGSTYSFYNEAVLNNYLNAPVDIEISESNVDRLDINKVVITVTRDGKEIELKDSWVSITEQEVDSRYFYRYKINKEAFSEDGKYSISIFSQALEGTNYTSVAEQYDFVIDRTNPEVIISGVQADKDYREYNRTVTVDTRDRSGIAEVKFFINGEEITDYTESDGIYSFVVNESSEYQTVTVEVTDMAGNSTSVSIENFLITSNMMVYLINQLWFMVFIAIALFLIVIMLIMIFLNRRKVKDDESEALKASGELYRSSSTVSTSGTSSKESSSEDGDKTSIMEDDSESKDTELLDK